MNGTPIIAQRTKNPKLQLNGSAVYRGDLEICDQVLSHMNMGYSFCSRNGVFTSINITADSEQLHHAVNQ